MEIKWNDLMKIGVQEIDEQHQTLIDAIDRLGEAMLSDQQSEKIEEVLTFIIQYSQTHFKTEEAYFDRYDGPEIQANKQDHAWFVKTSASFMEDFRKKGADLNLIIKIHKFLVDWLLQHILEIDTALRKYVQ
ncbi:hypothetical protein CSA56_07190 [candidate division KSB3 bacterium]|uniref:Hemerythrin-like domain-containing protein n=1 Tax=candidate division KSB3 bacterium TaxID=2044937 RepID=A0A2G6KHY3_9BACT|nr:MAG: hypothetical protein CSA56_07190 [candidate division KSB3 bacterium]